MNDTIETTPAPKRLASLAQSVTFAKRWGPPVAGAFAALAVSAFGWGVAWASFSARVDGFDVRLAVLEKDGSTPVRKRLEDLERDAAARREREAATGEQLTEILRRQVRVEQFLQRLVCKQWPGDPACTEAITLTPIP